MDCNITFLLNKRWSTYTGNPSAKLISVLIDEFELPETMCGCMEGVCGACSVIIDGKLRNSCLVAMGSLNGADIITIDSFNDADKAIATGHFAEYNIIADNKESVSDTVVISPTTLKEALINRKNPELIPCCGGTRILRGTVNDENRYLFLSQIPELRHITEDENYVRFGSACTFTEVIENEYTPDILRDMCMKVGSPAIRNAGSLGGNIACGCSDSDAALIFMVTDSKLHLACADGRRTIPIRNFYLDDGELDIEPDELIVEILMPRRGISNYYIEKINNESEILHTDVSIAGIIDIHNDIIRNFAVSFGALSDTIIHFHNIDKMFIGKTIYEAAMLKQDYLTAVEKELTQQKIKDNAQHKKTVCMNLLEDFIDNKVYTTPPKLF